MAGEGVAPMSAGLAGGNILIEISNNSVVNFGRGASSVVSALLAARLSAVISTVCG